ncbi:MAG: hypothetical protein AVDCRST_MAG60-746, partial [uncultured Nocardioides sp.]
EVGQALEAGDVVPGVGVERLGHALDRTHAGFLRRCPEERGAGQDRRGVFMRASVVGTGIAPTEVVLWAV